MIDLFQIFSFFISKYAILAIESTLKQQTPHGFIIN